MESVDSISVLWRPQDDHDGLIPFIYGPDFNCKLNHSGEF
jgi:hypothetical protein